MIPRAEQIERDRVATVIEVLVEMLGETDQVKIARAVCKALPSYEPLDEEKVAGVLLAEQEGLKEFQACKWSDGTLTRCLAEAVVQRFGVPHISMQCPQAEGCKTVIDVLTRPERNSLEPISVEAMAEELYKLETTDKRLHWTTEAGGTAGLEYKDKEFYRANARILCTRFGRPVMSEERLAEVIRKAVENKGFNFWSEEVKAIAHAIKLAEEERE